MRHLGRPKLPTLTVCSLVDGEYEVRRFRGEERVVSLVFPELVVTAAEVLLVGSGE